MDYACKVIKALRKAESAVTEDRDLYDNIYFAKQLQINRKHMGYLSYLRKVQRDLITLGDPLKKNMVDMISIFASLIESLDLKDNESI